MADSMDLQIEEQLRQELFTRISSWKSFETRLTVRNPNLESFEIYEEEAPEVSDAVIILGREDPAPEIKAAGAILMGKISSGAFVESIFSWCYRVFRDDDLINIGVVRDALSMFMEVNPNYREILIGRCYPRGPGEAERKVVRNFFSVMAGLVERFKFGKLQKKFVDEFFKCDAPLMVLFTMMVGGEEHRRMAPKYNHDVRYAAAKCLEIMTPLWLKGQTDSSGGSDLEPLIVPSNLEESSETVQRDLAVFFSKRFRSLCGPVGLEICKRIETTNMNVEQRRKAIERLCPWISSCLTTDVITIETLLRKLLQLAENHREENSSSFQHVWTSFCKVNCEFSLDIVLNQTCSAMESLENARDLNDINSYCIWLRRIEVYQSCSLSFLEASPQKTLLKLGRILFSAGDDGNRLVGPPFGLKMNFQNLELMRESNSPPLLSYSDAALVLLSVTLKSAADALLFHVPCLLHSSILVLDRRRSPYLTEMAKKLVSEVCHLLVFAHELRHPFENHEKLRHHFSHVQQIVLKKKNKPLWDLNVSSDSNSFASSAKKVEDFVDQLVAILEITNDSILGLWSQYALFYANKTRNFSFAVRSLQVFRVLPVEMSSETCSHLTSGLSFCLSKGGKVDEFTFFSVEILTSMKKLLRNCSSERLLLLSQVFWTGVALLDHPNENLKTVSVDIVLVFVLKLFYKDWDVSKISMVSSVIPNDWTWFEGVAPRLFRNHCGSRVTAGARTPLLFALMNYAFIPELKNLFDVGVSKSMMRNITGLLPWLCLQLENPQRFDENDWIPLVEVNSKVQQFLNKAKDGDSSLSEELNRIIGSVSKEELGLWLQSTLHRDIVASWLGIICKSHRSVKFDRLADVFFYFTKKSGSISLDTFLITLQKPLAHLFFPDFARDFFLDITEYLKSDGPYTSVVLRLLRATLLELDTASAAVLNDGKIASVFAQVVPLIIGENAEIALQILDLVIHKFGVNASIYAPPSRSVADQQDVSMDEIISRVGAIGSSYTFCSSSSNDQFLQYFTPHGQEPTLAGDDLMGASFRKSRVISDVVGQVPSGRRRPEGLTRAQSYAAPVQRKPILPRIARGRGASKSVKFSWESYGTSATGDT
mmetsp:Transcript_6983/g.17131  ORF Transcript_6983/g.17131 Transcript_6983/m.17131 type:complete len:1105 (+) Transcript_6983:723-4037(+)